MTDNDPQEPLNLVVVGVGGIGSALADDLAKMLNYKRPGSMLMLVDGDSFEPKNKERQNFDRLGFKASVKAAELTDRYEDTMFIPLNTWVVESTADEEAVVDGDNPDDDAPEATRIAASALLEDDMVVYAVVDNFKARRILIDAATQVDNIDVFLGGNDDALFGSTYHYQRRNGVEITGNPVYYQPELEEPTDRNPGDLSCEERLKLEGGTQLVATNRLVAALLLARTHHCIFEGNAPANGASIFFDMGNMCALNGSERGPAPVDNEATVEPALVGATN